MTYTEVSFDSAGVSCSAWHFRGAGDGPRPIVVMAHGFGGTKDSGLAPFAERLSAAGIDALAFDYRGFGASEGQPRQTLSTKRQIADYHAAVAAAKRLPGVDGVVLWGASFSGGHALRVAAERDDIAAVISLTPMTSGLAAGRAAVASRDVLSALRWTLTGVKSRIAVARGRSAIMMPLVARPGEPGALALDGAYESYLSMAGPTWRNEIDSAVGLEAALIRTTPSAKKLRCPVLVQIADFDRYVPADAVAKTAAHARAQVHHYPCDHFDVWPGHQWFDKVAADQVAFVTRALVGAAQN
ncbi:alpha/beta hydrolase [Mycobacterium hubeiense]|uniref:alpha/beta hydrolase n=1 Tax=Mycobacterium hubeiense TaxID=1867256 RepID=UPI000C7EBBD9|nr:alpha/beta fold hydrolase [Mycobacterium sp. QGD 101]